ncbi:MAG: sulfurase [Phycisphaerales bacterium]|nr:sulfurase [Phycisphaerales bacterium]
MPGTVQRLFIAPASRGAPVRVEAAEAVAGRGLVGDRYYLGVGAFSRWPGEGRQVTLIEAEAVETVLGASRVDLSDGRHRRNVVTRGVALAALVGRRFTVGPALLRGQRLCAPCRYLDRLIGAEVYDAMKGRGGLRAEVLEGGTIRAGDPITPVGPGRGALPALA